MMGGVKGSSLFSATCVKSGFCIHDLILSDDLADRVSVACTRMGFCADRSESLRSFGSVWLRGRLLCDLKRAKFGEGLSTGPRISLPGILTSFDSPNHSTPCLLLHTQRQRREKSTNFRWRKFVRSHLSSLTSELVGSDSLLRDEHLREPS